MTSHIAIGLQKDFNYHLTKMRAIGVLEKITERWTTRRKPKDYSDRIFLQVAGIRAFSSKNAELLAFL